MEETSWTGSTGPTGPTRATGPDPTDASGLYKFEIHVWIACVSGPNTVSLTVFWKVTITVLQLSLVLWITVLFLQFQAHSAIIRL